ncbi:hypothetical protein SUGI_1134970 [Cryptomeria japonica]|uniref:potassium channel AKT2/3-like n=1 Tax=Cryptomeria japonica TaxID=3369 RepID=UPI0024147F90|nr:potassium channel AKT2/3-like [Cryptomeria japonica]GLJ53255.1 hypothetical protein SUGI_1134970 [Cryptomeria japonica]
MSPFSKNSSCPLRQEGCKVIIYRHHPSKNGREAGNTVNLPRTISHLCKLAGKIYGFQPVKVFNEDGGEIKDLNVTRDNDKLFLCDREELEQAFHRK